MKIFLRLLGLFKPYRSWMALSVALSLASVLANVGLMAVSGWFVTAMALAGASGAAINYFTPAGIIRAFAIVRTGGRYGERVVSHDATLRLTTALRVWLYDKLEPLAPAVLQNYRSGDLYARLKSDIDRLELFFLRLLAPAAVAAIASVVVVTVMGLYHPAAAIALALILAVAGIVLPFYAVRAGARPSDRITATGSRLNVELVDTFEGLAELQIYGRGPHQEKRIIDLSESLIGDEMRLARLSALPQAGIGLAAGLAVWCVLLLVIPSMHAGDIAPAELTALALLALASFEAIVPLPLAVQSLSGTMSSARRIFEIADMSPAVRDPDQPEQLPPESDLAFHDVSFTYPDATRPALQNLDLALVPGRRVAIVGPSGSGKSSIVNLALRFWEPSSGALTLGGTPTARLRADDVRARIATVLQHAHIFTTTIAENLRVARPDASAADLENVCRIAQLHDFIAAQPKGYDTFVGAHGLELSGGQARRLAVARMLLKDAPVIILDEPTEGLDSANEQALLTAVLDARAHCAVLLISHRPAGLERMDEILIMEHGRVAERGTHSDLLAHSPRYRAIFDVIPGELTSPP